eukprot:SAG31_NODE_46282_length_255_cov_0.660256_1_plen_45_part_10
MQEKKSVGSPATHRAAAPALLASLLLASLGRHLNRLLLRHLLVLL